MAFTFNDPQTPVYAPNSFGGPHADPERAGDEGLWNFGTEAVRAGYVQHPEDDDFGQAGTLVRDVMDDAERERLVNNIVGHVRGGTSEALYEQIFEYWRNVDEELGKRVEAGVRAGA